MYSDMECFSSDERGYTKKTNKPMMEKKRRARINHCLSELKEILICDKHASAGHAKWEKADILEMTVDYLKKLRSSRGHTPIFHASVVAEEAAPAAPSQVKECDSTPTSTVPSPCSAESTSEGPPTAKRRRTAPSLTPPSSDESRPAAPAPPPQTPHSITALSQSQVAPTVMAPHLRPSPTSFSFMTQQLLALQYQQNLKMAAMAPGMLPTVNPLHPFTAMATIPWRTM
ncbi:hypothetical protein Q1695_005957 [Nippostrongylus brasiliensis]|nr:hypothetical protein Q1695_005957 [Nippostrongylus brasiliensis]